MTNSRTRWRRCRSPKTTLPFNEGDLAGYASTAIERLARFDPAGALDGLLDALAKTTDCRTALQIGLNLLDQHFAPVKQRRLPDELSYEQARALRAFVDSDAAWGYGNFSLAMDDYGLPRSRKWLRVFLGLDDPGANGETLRLEEDGDERPLWQWLDLADEGRVPATLVAAACRTWNVQRTIDACLAHQRMHSPRAIDVLPEFLSALSPDAILLLLQIVDQTPNSEAQPYALAAARIAAREGLPIDERLKSHLLRIARDSDTDLREVFSALPEDRRRDWLLGLEALRLPLLHTLPEPLIVAKGAQFLLESWRAVDPNDPDAPATLAGFAAFGEMAVPTLVEKLGGSRSRVREWLAMVLGKIGGELAVEALFHLLGDSSKGPRLRAMEALAALPFSDIEARLSTALQGKKATRQAAAELLARIGK